MGLETSLEAALKGRRVLVVEDDRALLELLTDYLELQGAETIAVESGEAALRELQSERPPEMAVLDIRMPGISGADVLRHIRETPRLARTPVVVITGVPGGELQLVGSPDELLTKPFDVESLGAALSRMSSRS